MRPGKAVHLLFLGGGIALLTFLAVMGMLYPYSLREWVECTLAHARMDTAGFSHSGVVASYLVRPEVPAFGLFLFLSVFSGLSELSRRWNDVTSKPLVLLGTALLVAWVWHFALASPGKLYNLVPLVPLASCVLLLCACRVRVARSVSRLHYSTLWARFLLMGAISVPLIPSLALVRVAVLFGLFLKSGMSFEDSRASLSRLRSENAGIIAVSSSLWLQFDDLSCIRLVPNEADWTRDPGTMQRYRIIVLQQYKSSRTTPEILSRYRIVENSFVERPVSIFGLRIANSFPGYQFAVYRLRGDT
jgi:hypothetical protein